MTNEEVRSRIQNATGVHAVLTENNDKNKKDKKPKEEMGRQDQRMGGSKV